MNIKYRTITKITLLILIAIFLFACTSRYRLDLFLISENSKTRIKIEESEYILNSELNLPSETVKTRQGNGNCLIIITGNSQKSSDKLSAISYDEHIRYKLFIQLPSEVNKSIIPLLNNAYVNLLGHYEIEPALKLYFPISGIMVIDSLTKKNLFANIDAEFINEKSNTKISFSGKFKADFKR